MRTNAKEPAVKSVVAIGSAEDTVTQLLSRQYIVVSVDNSKISSQQTSMSGPLHETHSSVACGT